jgi:hypothetical protein
VRSPLLYSFIRHENIVADVRIRAGLSKCNHVTVVGGARGQVASLITGVGDLVTCSLYFSWKLVGLVLKVATQRYRNFMETILLYLLTVCVMDRPVLFVDSHWHCQSFTMSYLIVANLCVQE